MFQKLRIHPFTIFLLLVILIVCGYFFRLYIEMEKHNYSQLNEDFKYSLKVGMTREDVELIFDKNQQNPVSIEFKKFIGFRGQDMLAISKLPDPLPERVWWFDGKKRAVYVEFVNGKVWRAKLFGPDWEYVIGGE